MANLEIPRERSRRCGLRTEPRGSEAAARRDVWAEMSALEREWMVQDATAAYRRWLAQRKATLDAAIAAGMMDAYDPLEYERVTSGVARDEDEPPFPQGEARPWSEVVGVRCRSDVMGRVYEWLRRQEAWVTTEEVMAGVGLDEAAVRNVVVALDRRGLLVRGRRRLESGYWGAVYGVER